LKKMTEINGKWSGKNNRAWQCVGFLTSSCQLILGGMVIS